MVSGSAPKDKPNVVATKAHPTRSTANRQIALGVVALVLAALFSILITPPMGIGFALYGVFFLWVGTFVRQNGTAVTLNNRAFDLVARGRSAEAEAMLDSIPVKRGPIVERAVALQRATIALYRGKTEDAEAHATRAIEGRMHWLSKDYEESQRASAYAVRAQARAIAGNAEGALADVKAARATNALFADGHARASIAECILLAKRENKADLATLLAKDARVLALAGPRERVLVRAFSRMVRAPKPSIYREPARPDADTDGDQLADWVAKAAPQAAAYVNPTVRAAQMEKPRIVEAPPTSQAIDARAAVHRSRPNATRARIAVVWVVLVGFLLAMFSLISSNGGTTVHTDALFSSLQSFGWLVSGILGLAIGLIMYRLARGRKATARLRAAVLEADIGDTQRGLAELRKIADGKAPALASQALLALAYHEERACKVRDAIRDVESAISRINASKVVRDAYSDIHVPELIAERAFLLATQGMTDGASAELLVLERDFPAYPYLSRALLRTRMVLATRASDFESATTMARNRTPDLRLFGRDDVLADILVGGSGDDVPEGEIERIDEMLSRDQQTRDWLKMVAPGALDRYERSRVQRARIAAFPQSAVSEEAEAEANAEHEAVQEAAAEEESRNTRAKLGVHS